MGKAFSIARLQLRRTVKSKGLLITMLVLPLMLTLIFGVIISGSGSGESGRVYDIAVADLDQSFASDSLLQALDAQDALHLVPAVDSKEIKQLLSNKDVSLGLIIPSGFEAGLSDGTAPDLQVVKAPSGNLEAAVGPMLYRELNRLAADYQVASVIAQDEPERLEEAFAAVLEKQETIAIGTDHQQVEKADTQTEEKQVMVGQTSLGFTVMFVLMLVFVLSGVILDEREAGTWGRLLSTPTRRTEILGGYLLSFFLTGMLQFLVLIGASRLLFGISWGPPLPLLILASTFVLCSAGLGLFLAGIVRTGDQQRSLGSLVVVATSMLGGVFWPLEYVTSRVMRTIGYLTPQAWAIEGFREVMLRGGSVGDIVLPLTVLLGFSAFFLGVGLFRVRYE